jgi:hypothetical protein
MSNKLLRCCLPALSILVLACTQATPDAKKLGVYAGTNHGVIDLNIFGEQTGMTSYSVPDLNAVPKAANVKAFFVNLPDIKVSNCRIYWVDSLAGTFREDKATAEPTTTESVEGSMYKLSSPQLSDRTGGYLLFKVGMELGTSDRIYPVKLGE